LAARIMAEWKGGAWPQHPQRERILRATAQHDCGWWEFDASPSVNPATGMPYDVVGAPLGMRQGAWRVALDRLTPDDPYLAALVAHHAITVYARYEGLADWEYFFGEMEQRRNALLQCAEIELPRMLVDYPTLGLGDRWSLMFCYGWREPNQMHGYEAVLDVERGELRVSPDAFDDASVRLDVKARRIPQRFYKSDEDLHRELERAEVVMLDGVAMGTPPAISKGQNS
jgi:hypothetical protein